MQQAYRALRVVSEAQTIRIVLSSEPTGLMLAELHSVCAALNIESSSGIKAVVLDFHAGLPDIPGSEDSAFPLTAAEIGRASAALLDVAQPVLAVIRATPSAAASMLMRAADLTLAAHDAVLLVSGIGNDASTDTLRGEQAARMGYVTWAVPAGEIHAKMRQVLDVLRGKSAVALRHVKASVRLASAGQGGDHARAQKTDRASTPSPEEDQAQGAERRKQSAQARLEVLTRVNALYLTEVMHSADAHEGLRAFLEKRQPDWKNS